jgi:hypothetical protein
MATQKSHTLVQEADRLLGARAAWATICRCLQVKAMINKLAPKRTT